MGRFEVVANAMRARLVLLGDRLLGCSHRRTTFPITLQAAAILGGQQSAEMETYVVCLACGRHFAYDWTKMRISRQRCLDLEAAGAGQPASCDGDG